MNRILLIVLFTLSITHVFCQTRRKGVAYYPNYDKYGKFYFTRLFQESDTAFVTVYTLYSSATSNDPAYIVTASHIKGEKKFVIRTQQLGGSIFDYDKTRTFDYDSLTTKPQGYSSALRLVGGKKIPYDFSYVFVSDKFENIKVLSINPRPTRLQDTEFFLLDEH